MKSHEMLSKAFSKSINNISPSIFLRLLSVIMSYISLVHSFIVLPSKKPFCSGLIIFFNKGRSVLVIHVEIILYDVFNKEIGRQFFMRFLDFPVFGRQVIVPSKKVFGK